MITPRLFPRPATAADTAEITALEAEIFGADAWSADTVRREVAHTLVVVAPQLCSYDPKIAADQVMATQLCGYVVVTVAGDVADLQRIGVHRGHRRQGAAGALLAAGLKLARAGGARRMLLEVSEDNLGALAFYVGQGFSEIDRRPRYYRDGADAIVLELPLDVRRGVAR